MAEVGEPSSNQEQGGEWQNASLPVHIVGGTFTGVLSDDSFAIPTDEIKTCLRITKELVKCFYQPSIESERFASNVLAGVITKSKKRD